jgi:DNA mismatch repair protein MutS
MRFESILFENAARGSELVRKDAPDFFTDLNLDQIVAAIIESRRQEYDLESFFYSPLTDIDEIAFRHEVMKDLENRDVLDRVRAFAQTMRLVRQELGQSAKLYYRYQKQWWFLDAVDVYCKGVQALRDDLHSVDVHSRGFAGLRAYLDQYVASERFIALGQEITQIKSELSAIRYCILIRGNAVTVRHYESEPNYSIEVERTFEKFSQVEAKDYRVKFRETVDMNHVEANILESVARLHEDTFEKLERFWTEHQDFPDAVITRFDHEVQFYVSYLEFIDSLRQAGLPFCYPRVSRDSKETLSRDGFDLALARKLVVEKKPVVLNDFQLTGKERVFIVSGPNQGGKTTFARTFGQLHYLAALGLPVPGREARLFLFDRLFTHFEREEKVTDLRSKLEHDLIRLRNILREATPDSVVVLNESFGSTTLKDAIFLGRQIMNRILELDMLAVYVTFVTELASLSDKIVSMVSTVVPDNPAARTYRIIRRPSDGRAYAISIAEKYRLTYEALRERLAS